MNDDSRFRSPWHQVRADAADDLEVLDEPAVERLTIDLETCVSHGAFGTAAHISDQLRGRGAAHLRARPDLSFRVRTEELKRLAYMGYRNAVATTAGALLDDLVDGCGLAPDRRDLLRFVVLGEAIWVEADPRVIASHVVESETLLAAGRLPDALIPAFEGFLDGSRARERAVLGDLPGARRLFATGLERMAAFPRSAMHLHLIEAEHLAGLGAWTEALVKVADFFRVESAIQFRSHLVLRAVALQLGAPSQLLSPREAASLSFRCFMLSQEVGLSSGPLVYPLLRSVRSRLEEWSASRRAADVRGELAKWLWSRSAEQMEIVLQQYYRLRGFEAMLLPRDIAAFDVVANLRSVGFTQQVAIQIKHRKRCLLAADVPDEEGIARAGAHLRETMGLLPGAFHWHCSGGIHEKAHRLLLRRLRTAFGEVATLRTTDVAGLVDDLLDLGPTLPELLFHGQLQDEMGAQ